MMRLLRSLVLLVLLVLASGCAGELPREDGKVSDLSATPDQPPWPDLPPPRPEAQLPLPDGYKSAAFGCAQDSDCFGQRCCSTPWGVKLCSPVCDPR
jgi:hypothetical protein